MVEDLSGRFAGPPVGFGGSRGDALYKNKMTTKHMGKQVFVFPFLRYVLTYCVSGKKETSENT